jgi:mannose-1-phosphate guanylyltransferase
MKDVVVVDTPDALLVTTKDHAQDVKQIVEHMREQGLDTLL